VQGLDLFVADGEFLVLVGPSGKTTALRMVAGLEEITDGTISLDGRIVNDPSPRERDIAMVFQNYALYPHLNVHQNIGFSLSMRKVPKVERDRKVREAAELLGLSELLAAKPRQLSGGQRQRVAMGRALVREPAVFLMDEPFSNLDAKLRVQMRAEVLRVQRRLGVATLYVTHDQTEAMTMGDRVAVMRSGVLQQLAPPQELYDQPVNLFVADFMGSPSMNLYEASVSAGSDQLEVTLGSQTLALPGDANRYGPELSAASGRDVVVGIRPEHLTLIGSDAATAGPLLRADVELVEALGNELLVHFVIDAARLRNTEVAREDPDEVPAGAAAAPAGTGVARVNPRADVSVNQRVSFAVDVDRLHFFDPRSGLAFARDTGASTTNSSTGLAAAPGTGGVS
jgi:multiple sugar transport system ATP-binding protein